MALVWKEGRIRHEVDKSYRSEEICPCCFAKINWQDKTHSTSAGHNPLNLDMFVFDLECKFVCPYQTTFSRAFGGVVYLCLHAISSIQTPLLSSYPKGS